MRIQIERKEVKFLYIVVIIADLLFLFMNTPWMSLPIVEGQPAQLTSVFDFIKYQFDLKIEQNVATWYSSVLLLAAGVMAVINCRYGQVRSTVKWIHNVGWSLMAVVLIALSADETATIHETLARLLNAMNQGSDQTPYRVGAGDWIPILLPIIVITAVCMPVFFFYLFRNHKSMLLLTGAAILCWVGAIYAESIEAGMTQLRMGRVTEGFIEEGFEIVGTTCLLISFTEFFQQRQPDSEFSTTDYMAKSGQKSRSARR